MLIIESREATEVYPSHHGFVVIKQTSHVGEESLVFIHPDDIPALINALTSNKEEAEEIRDQSDFVLGKGE